MAGGCRDGKCDKPSPAISSHLNEAWNLVWDGNAGGGWQPFQPHSNAISGYP
ncbi:hypothetical protein BD779DRAFT_1574770 [Infundibulicybe gibba]|nr:hypothetical protein BD779DRAFT_1574770 [Infundibulicybe gibba]